ncbi:MAG: hypothetical protein ACOCRU_00715 [bacterium]
MLEILNTLVNYSYYGITILISLLLIKEIIKTEDIYEVVLYSIILVPFVLRSLHLK